MGTYVAKLKNDNHRWYKIADQITNEEYEKISLDDAVVYDPNNTEGNQWFKVEGHNINEDFRQVLDRGFDTADLESLSYDQFSRNQIDYIAYYYNNRYYIQSFTKGSYMKKKGFSFNGEAVEYFSNDGIVFINPIPNCIYDNQTQQVFFQDISKTYCIFGDLRLDYIEATAEETERLLQSDLLLTDDFTSKEVGTANRKRITSILKKIEQYNEIEKSTLRKYIREKVGNNLEYDTKTERFVIKNDKQLKILLYGIQQRYYQTPFEKEVQVATSKTDLSKLLK